MIWTRRFDVPIVLDDGSTLVTLQDAGLYVTNLPAAKQKEPHWQTAAGELLSAAERGGILMLAEIAIRQALAHGKPKPPGGSAEKGREEIQDRPMKDAFDQWWEWARKPLDSPLTIPASIHNPIMALPEDDRQDRQKVNEAVRQYDGR